MDEKGIYSYREGVALPITRARLEIAGQTAEREVAASDKSIAFRLRVPKGDHRVRAWFTNDDGLSLGAYHVYVRRAV